MTNLRPITTTTRVTDVVHQTLREAILAGELNPGSKLSVPALAAALDVSRSPVREAVVRLTQERLAVEAPRQGAVVAAVSTEELAELYHVREMLEGLAARLAVERAGPELARDLDEVLTSQRAAVEAGDLERHIELDMRFHTVVRAASGNAHVVRVLDEIQALVRLAMLTTTVTGGPRNAVCDHEAILDAIRTGDPVAAEARSREHIARLRSALATSTPAPREPGS